MVELVSTEDLAGIWVKEVFAVPGRVDRDGMDICPVALLAVVDVVLVLA